jgi:hypothetical protein
MHSTGYTQPMDMDGKAQVQFVRPGGDQEVTSAALEGQDTQSPSKADLEVQKLRLEIAELERTRAESKSGLELEKLRIEISGLQRSQKWDRQVGRFIPIATAVIALAGFWFGIFQFTKNDQRQQDLREKEFKRAFWEKQLSVYTETVDLAAELANRQNAKDAEPLYRRFTDLYHGQMVLYEDPEVLSAMKAFTQVYIEYQRDPGLQNDAKEAARTLAHACRKALSSTWNIPLKDLDMSKF